MSTTPTGFGNHVSGQVVRVKQQASASVSPADTLKPKGRYTVTHYRDGKVIGVYDAGNAVVNVGKDNLLGVMFNAATQTTTWYIGLINNSPAPTENVTDTMASHSGWVEATGYSEANRVAWPEDTPASQSITNSTSADFSINATATIYGIFLVSDNTKSGTTGTLWSTAAFAAPVAVASGDTLKVTYTLSVT